MRKAACVLAVLLMLAPAGAMGQASRRPKTAAPAWGVTITQIDKQGTVVGEPLVFDCTPTGCEQLVKFDVEGKSYGFVASFSFVPKGAYVAIQPTQPEVSRV